MMQKEMLYSLFTLIVIQICWTKSWPQPRCGRRDYSAGEGDFTLIGGERSHPCPAQVLNIDPSSIQAALRTLEVCDNCPLPLLA